MTTNTITCPRCGGDGGWFDECSTNASGYSMEPVTCEVCGGGGQVEATPALMVALSRVEDAQLAMCRHARRVADLERQLAEARKQLAAHAGDEYAVAV